MLGANADNESASVASRTQSSFGIDSLLDGTAFASEVVMAAQVPFEWMSCSNIQEKLPVGTVGKIQAIVVSHDNKLRDITRKSSVEDMCLG